MRRAARRAEGRRRRRGRVDRRDGRFPGRRVTVLQVRYLQKFFTHRSVSTLDRISFQLTCELFLYGMALSSRVSVSNDGATYSSTFAEFLHCDVYVSAGAGGSSGTPDDPFSDVQSALDAILVDAVATRPNADAEASSPLAATPPPRVVRREQRGVRRPRRRRPRRGRRRQTEGVDEPRRDSVRCVQLPRAGSIPDLDASRPQLTRHRTPPRLPPPPPPACTRATGTRRSTSRTARSRPSSAATRRRLFIGEEPDRRLSS